MGLSASEWARHWGCHATGAAFHTEGAELLPVRRGAQELMLKVMGPGSDEAAAPAILRALGGRSAVIVHAAEGPALLMERLMPAGPSLETLALDGEDDRATRIICDIGLAMQDHLAGADVPGVQRLDQGLGDLRRAPDAFSRWVMGLAAELLADTANWTLLHGDLHHFNLIHDATRGWLAIDPKGLIGPPVYDLANTILNPYPHAAHVHDPARMARQTSVVAERIGLPVAQVLAWVCLHGARAASWGDPGDYWSKGAWMAGGLAGLSLPDPGQY